MNLLKAELEDSLNRIVDWLTKSGLKVNESKTELCLFSRHDHPSFTINVGLQEIKSKTQIGVLGVIFDSKLQWGPQVSSTMFKATKALNAIKLIKKNFNSELITSNVYSILFYNSEVWHLQSLHHRMKQQLLSVSARAIKVCTHATDVHLISFEDLHEMVGRATPDKLMIYKLSLQLYRTYNQHIPTQDWVKLNYNGIFTSRQSKFMTRKENKLKVGLNSVSNRFFYLNGKIELDWLNLSYNSYKIKCKNLFL